MAKVPNITNAEIADAKLTGYLLSSVHPDGGPKAKFLASFGFVPANASQLRAALLAHAAANNAAAPQQTDFGVIYEVVGRLQTPDNRNPVVKVVWMIDTGTQRPRLITLVPSEEPKP